MTARFDSKIVLVTGAGSGLGRAIALAFADQGAYVAVAGRTAESVAQTVELIERTGGAAAAVIADVSRPTDVEALLRQTVEHFGGLDIAVNNAGVFRGGQPLADMTHEDWHTLLDVNVTGVLLCMQAEIAHMRASGGGAIVNISANLGAHRRAPGVAGYVASKAAVSALTRNGALDHIRDGIRINAVSPGASDTSMSLRPGEDEGERAARMKDQSPLGRVSSTDEIASTVLYLASPEAASVVGADFVIDGGASA